MPTGPIVIRVPLRVEIDPDEWTATFNITKRADIADEVRAYVLNLVRDGGVFGDGEVSADIKIQR